MDAYFLKDAKTAVSRLDADLDEYFQLKDKAKAANQTDTAGTTSIVCGTRCVMMYVVVVSEKSCLMFPGAVHKWCRSFQVRKVVKCLPRLSQKCCFTLALKCGSLGGCGCCRCCQS